MLKRFGFLIICGYFTGVAFILDGFDRKADTTALALSRSVMTSVLRETRQI